MVLGMYRSAHPAPSEEKRPWPTSMSNLDLKAAMETP